MEHWTICSGITSQINKSVGPLFTFHKENGAHKRAKNATNVRGHPPPPPAPWPGAVVQLALPRCRLSVLRPWCSGLTSSLRITSLNSRLIRDTAMFAMMFPPFLGLSFLLSPCSLFTVLLSPPLLFTTLFLLCSVLPLFLLLPPRAILDFVSVVRCVNYAWLLAYKVAPFDRFSNCRSNELDQRTENKKLIIPISTRIWLFTALSTSILPALFLFCFSVVWPPRCIRIILKARLSIDVSIGLRGKSAKIANEVRMFKCLAYE